MNRRGGRKREDEHIKKHRRAALNFREEERLKEKKWEKAKEGGEEWVVATDTHSPTQSGISLSMNFPYRHAFTNPTHFYAQVRI